MLLSNARSWAQSFDANGFIVLLLAQESFDIRPQLTRIKAKVLYMLSRTDEVFPPRIAPGVMADLKAAGVDARYVEVDTDVGHMAFEFETDKWSPALKSFLAELMGSR
jgi:homoserine O-acetyltransferase